MVCWQSVAINVPTELLHLILELDELKPETSWWGTTWRCFCLWHGSVQGAGSVSLQGKALRLPAPHNFTPNLNFKVALHYYTDSSFPCRSLLLYLPPSLSLLNRSSDWVSRSVSVSFCPPCSTHLMSAGSIIDDLRGLAVTGCLHRLSRGESDNAPGPDAAAGLQ